MISKKFAVDKFNTILNNVKKGGTSVREVISMPMNKLDNVQKVLEMLPHGTAIWQHTPNYHFAGIYIEKGQGYAYNRAYLDLISSGIDTEEKFLRAWDKQNDYGINGVVPKVKKETTKAVRQNHASYVVANLRKGANQNSKLPSLGFDKSGKSLDGTDRTHLISSQVTGIENHKGLLIDFDSYLNRKPLNDYETNVLKTTNYHDVVWTCLLWQKSDGLHFRYTMLDEDYHVVSQKEWICDRWEYFWFYDEYQSEI